MTIFMNTRNKNIISFGHNQLNIFDYNYTNLQQYATFRTYDYCFYQKYIITSHNINMKKKLEPYGKDSAFHFPELTGWNIDYDQNNDFNIPYRNPIYATSSQIIDHVFSHKKISTQPSKLPNEQHRYSNIQRQRKNKCYTKLPQKITQSNILKAKLYLKTEKNLDKLGKIKQQAFKLQSTKPITRKFSHLIKNKSERNLQHFQTPINLNTKSKYMNFPIKNQYSRQSLITHKQLLENVQLRTKQIKFTEQNILKRKIKQQLQETDRIKIDILKDKEVLFPQKHRQHKKKHKMMSSSNVQLLMNEFNDDFLFVRRN